MTMLLDIKGQMLFEELNEVGAHANNLIKAMMDVGLDVPSLGAFKQFAAQSQAFVDVNEMGGLVDNRFLEQCIDVAEMLIYVLLMNAHNAGMIEGKPTPPTPRITSNMIVDNQ